MQSASNFHPLQFPLSFVISSTELVIASCLSWLKSFLLLPFCSSRAQQMKIFRKLLIFRLRLSLDGWRGLRVHIRD
jgi:hypothetical protein